MNPTLATIDYVVIAGYMIFALGVGVVLSRKASESSENYFLAGRTLPWWLAGISMVATSFASDTPIVLTEMVRQYGLQRIWWLFSACIALSPSMFLFSRLWRRAEITTDAEFYELRYTGRSAAFLRGFRASYKGVLQNFITMAWVTLAMTKVITTVADVDQWMVVAVCAGVALTYATFSGFYGVVVTDFVQFFIAVGGMIYLGILSWSKTGGFEVIFQKVSDAAGYGAKTFDLFPDFSRPSTDLLALLIFTTVLWWTDSGEYKMQRMGSCKDERNSILAAIFDAVFQTSRAWIWIPVALVSIVLFPDVSNTEAYPMVMNAYLGPGMKGLVVTGFLAAFMSTIDTHLNWGASYIMTDIYRRFWVKEGTEKHYMMVTRIAVVLLMLGACLVVPLFKSVTSAWELLAFSQAGLGIIHVLRWFWWRITAFTEIAVLLGSCTLTLMNIVIMHLWPDWVVFGMRWIDFRFEQKITIFIAIVIPLAAVVTHLTPPVPQDTLEKFYRRVRPGGFWGVLDPQIIQLPGKALSLGTVADLLFGLMLMFGISLGIGYSILQQYKLAMLSFLVAVMGGLWLYRWFRREMAAQTG